ncbi:OBAP family protein [Luteolibacter sp. GHJ8]|uniref:OBAP family protein n=1 Tax=Luteolibacter rhizosphaerae TaxID=2989719 RepID=A0ABT3FZF1_9BACT|nr:OBAP family protein [Luteolibacter rhizosphaerae]MCW1912967.1 OBAP family protein [Luteolibacter rhizosphaerae]
MKTFLPILVLTVPVLLALSCKESPEDKAHAGGEDKRGKTKLLEAGAEALQSEAPLKSIHAHVCGFHFYNGDIKRQVTAHHYCSHLGEEIMQCVIYDTDKPDAKLIGIEYIITAKLFEGLDPEEKKLWHSHVHEVQSGQLIAPRIPAVAEKQLMKHLVGTYGKTWHTWQVDRGDELPLGIPQLMMGFTKDGQAESGLIKSRDEGYGISSDEKKRDRSDIPAPQILPGANNWESGEAVQLESRTIPAK